ncbi:2-C-methyl-D-erythritol 4-phosphate cytidylyltransferase [Christensenellaceae bacterium OttesenSCG-928-K19]|nr:2-C-methyl-D-erythritol 4-phosphate cytidylyltransferase [Christensenellaceae bacterium OttesenSCG-928-K19]
MNVCAVILAAGSGKRMELDTNKVFIKFDDQSAVVRCLKTFEGTGLFSSIVVVCRPEEREIIRRKAARYLKGNTFIFCDGGAERQYSVENALEYVPEEADIIAVHDAARCFVTHKIIKDCVSSAIRFGSGVAGIGATDTIKRTQNGVVTETLKRDELICVQTPQVFRVDVLKKAYKKAVEDGFLGTDDASLVERLGETVHIVSGSVDNIKLTTQADVAEGEKIAEEQAKKASDIRIGNGFDMHAFAQDRKLILGGVDIPSEFGLDGHSDADVLVHAIMDALLGASRLGDIGKLFPPDDMRFKDISSIKLLKEVGDLLRKYGYKIVNIDSTVIMQAPKISSYSVKMIKNIAQALDMDEIYVNVKATTTEYLGALGRGEGAAAQAVCILQKR